MVNTIQDVKAADNSTDAIESAALKKVMEQLKSTIEQNVSISAVEGSSKDSMVEWVKDAITNNSAVKTVLSSSITVDGGATVDGYEISAIVDNAEIDELTADTTKWNVAITVKSKTPGVNKSDTVTVDVLVNTYTAEKILTESNLTSTYPEQTFSLSGSDAVDIANITGEIEKVANGRLDDFISANGIKYPNQGDLKINISGASLDFEKTTWSGTLQLTNQLATDTVSADISAPIRVGESAADAALQKVAEELQGQELKIKLGIEAEKGRNISTDVQTLVNEAIEDAKTTTDYLLTGVTLTGGMINSEGTAITGVLNAEKARPITVSIPINVVTIDTITAVVNPKTTYDVTKAPKFKRTDKNNDMVGAVFSLKLSTGNTITITEEVNADGDVQGHTDFEKASDDVAAGKITTDQSITNSPLLAVDSAVLEQAIAAKQLGASVLTISAKDMGGTSLDIPVKVAAIKTVDEEEIGFEDGTTLATVETEDDTIAAATINAAHDGLTVYGYEPGETMLTVSDNKNNVRSFTVKVYEYGAVVIKPVVATDPIYITISDDIIGFEVDEESNPIVVSTDKDAFSAEYTTRDGKLVVKVIPTGKENTETDAAKANLVLTDESGNLLAGYHIDIDLQKGISRAFKGNNIATVSFNESAKATITNTKFYTSERNTDVTDKITFKSEDKVEVVTATNSIIPGSEEIGKTTVTFPASDAEEFKLVGSNVSAKFFGKQLANVPVSVMTALQVSRQDLLSNIGTADGEISYVLNDNTTPGTGYVEAAFDAAGNLIIKPLVTAKTGDIVKIVINDEYITGRIILNGQANGIFKVAGYEEVRNELAGKDGEYTAPIKRDYYIGESLDVTGASYTYVKDGKLVSLEITDKMYSGFDSSTVTTVPQTVKFNYAGIGTLPKYNFDVNILARTRTITADDIALVNAGIESISYTGDAGMQAELEDGIITLTATKISQEGAIQVTADDGRVVNIEVSIDETGNFTVGSIPFEIHSVSITKDELDLTPYLAESDDESIVTASVADEKVILESVAPGTASVVVTDRDEHKAVITVKVAKDGSITYTVSPYVAAGWVDLGNGDWGYIQDGERVVSKWISVIEEDPYNNNEVGEVWYHFGADGKMQRGWISDPEAEWKIYLLDSNGRMMHSDWVNAPEQKELNRPAGIYHLTADGAVQMNGWALAKGSDSVYWFCNAGNGLFERDNPASWANEKLW